MSDELFILTSRIGVIAQGEEMIHIDERHVTTTQQRLGEIGVKPVCQ